MAGFGLELPTLQNWSCHSCAGCCRQHAIEVTEEERRRIQQQNWREEDGIDADQPLFAWHAGPPWKKRYRLAHQSDGSCVFLDEKGLCRIHKKFGEAAKPLPCRIYPYAFHPNGKGLTVSLRFSCPSVVANKGQPVAEQSRSLKKLARQVLPEEVTDLPPPPVSRREKVGWPDFRRFLNALDETLAEADQSVLVKLLTALGWVSLVAQARFDAVRGERLDEFLDLVRQAAAAEVPGNLEELGEPSRAGRMQFRLLCAQYARKGTIVEQKDGLKGRWRLLKAAVRFARGRGTVPPLQEVFGEVPFEALERPMGGLPSEAEEMLSRYFRVKVQGLHFCGPAYYHVPFVEGFRSLALIYPAILWLARWLSLSDGRQQWTAEDIARAVSLADHHHGYSPAFGQWSFRRRVQTLARLGDIERLSVWYSR